jgi:hypothetical protein
MKNPKLQQTVGTGNPLIIQEVGSTAVISSSMPAALEDFYIHPFGKPGHALEGLFYQAVRLMRASGVADENIQTGLIILSVLSSISVEIPLSIVLRVQNDSAPADHLLSTCLRFVSSDLIVELQRLKPDELFSSGNSFRNKALICRELPGLKKVEPDLKSLIINGKVSIQSVFRGKSGAITSTVEVLGPVAFIGIEKEDDQQLFDHPSIIRIPVSDGSSYSQYAKGTSNQEIAIDFEIDRVAEYISRFRRRGVTIPFEKQLSRAILAQRPIGYVQKNRFVRSLIEVLTMLNNPDSIDNTSLLAKLIKSRPEHIREYLRANGAEYLPVVSPDVELVSGKTEYFILSRLLQSVIPLKYQSPSPLRKQIFNALKDINLKSFRSSTLGDTDILEKLYTLSNCDLYWARLELIFKRINKGRVGLVPIPVIETELTVLKKMGFIARKKFRESDNYGYYILVLAVDENLKFPEVHELFGESLEDQ